MKFRGLLLLLLLLSCSQQHKETTIEPENGIYYWKTTFSLKESEKAFLEKNSIKRLYIRMFDVGVEDNLSEIEAVPIVTTRFIETPPKGIQIVPVVFITVDALRLMNENEREFATLIVDRAEAMCRHNRLGDMKELQLDCDWTSSTQKIFYKLCEEIMSCLGKNQILSSTIRLHQLTQEAPPVDKGVLMVYNTGAIKNPDTNNSIIDYNDIEPYIKRLKSKFDYDIAYPIYSWAILFRENKFVSILRTTDFSDTKLFKAIGNNKYEVLIDKDNYQKGDIIRVETPTINELQKVKKLVEDRANNPNIILYHLDSLQISKFSDNEIQDIYTLSH